jgi:hypothetical protein
MSPYAGKPLGLASHTSATSWMCMVHSLDVTALFLIQFIKSDRLKKIHSYLPVNDCLELKY